MNANGAYKAVDILFPGNTGNEEEEIISAEKQSDLFQSRIEERRHKSSQDFRISKFRHHHYFSHRK